MKEVSFPTPYTLFPVSPDEKIFTPTDERGFFPYTPHPFGHRPSIYIGFAEKAFRGVRSEYSVFRCGFSVHCSQQNTPHFPTSPLPYPF
jgi:hypothetical protein